MGQYVYANTLKSAIKRARKEAPKSKTVVKVNATRKSGVYYATTRLRKGYR